MDSDNQLLNSLTNTLNCQIKYLALANSSFYNDKNSLIQKDNCIICLGTQKVFFLQDDLNKEILTVDYKLLRSIEEIKKNDFNLYIITNNISKLKEDTVTRILITTSENRGALIKNFMCYYSVYFMENHFKVRSLIFEPLKEQRKPANNSNEKGGLRTLPSDIKFYNFNYVGQVVKDKYNQDLFNLVFKYDADKSKEDKKKGPPKNYSDKCNIHIEISEAIPLWNFETNKDCRDLSYTAYVNFFEYMKSMKIEHKNFWIIKKKIYYKKFNINEDPCRWEGWTIEARTFLKEKITNYIFVYLRRKFLPPFFDTYQDIRFVLSEECSPDNTDINPKAHQLLELITGTLHSTETFQSVNQRIVFLKAKIESLLIDEETLFFLQNINNNIKGDLFVFGLTLFWNFLNCFYKTSKPQDLSDFKQELNDHPEILETALWKDKNNNYQFTKNIDEIININSNHPAINEQKKGMILDTQTASPEDETFNIKIESDRPEKYSNDVWKNKVYRLVAYVLNGGFFKHKITLESFIDNTLMKYPSSEIQSIIILCLNLFNEESKKVIHIQDDVQPEVKFSFNEDVVAVILKTGLICKLVVDSSNSNLMKIIVTILTTHPTIKILSIFFYNLDALHELLIEVYNVDNVGTTLEEAYLRSFIKPLLDIFKNKEKCPIILTLACKCLILLCSNKQENNINIGDLFRKKILIEGEIIDRIADYLKEYAFDEKLVLCCLDLFSLIMKEIELPINDKLYGDLKLYEILRDFLSNPKIPGLFFSQRVSLIIIITFS
jgi:hypothetical protein